MSVTVAAIQCSSDLGEVERNCAKLTYLIREAAARGARIVVMPEAAITGYLSQDLQQNWHLPGRPLERVYLGRDPLPYAQTVPGPATDHFASLARELGIYLAITFVEREVGPPTDLVPSLEIGWPDTSGVRLFNAAVLLSPAGEIVAHYRKIHPWPHPEQSWASPGNRGVQFADTEYGRIGLAICFDIHSVLESYQPHRLWTLLHPIAWADEEHPANWFWHQLPRRIAPFGHHVVGANWSVDRPQPWHGYGFSSIYAADGRILNTAASLYGSYVVYAELPT